MNKMRQWGLLLSSLMALGLVGQTLGASYGVNKTIAECQGESRRDSSKYLSGDLEPYSYTGPSPSCTAPGCQDGFFGPKCRFEMQPSCPLHLRRGLTGWLRHWANLDASWARDILTLTPCQLWPLVKGRTIWFIGDSMSLDLAINMACFFVEYNILDPEKTDPRGFFPKFTPELAAKLSEGARYNQSAYWCNNFDKNTTICHVSVEVAERMKYLIRLMPKFAEPQDVVILNVGMHYNQMSNLTRDVLDIANTFNGMKPVLPERFYWKETNPQHFKTPSGMLDMNTPIEEQRCSPTGAFHGITFGNVPDGSLVVDEGIPDHFPESKKQTIQTILEGGHRNVASQLGVQKMGIKILPLFNKTLPLWQFHRDIQHQGDGGRCDKTACDCTHVCIPSYGPLIYGELRRLLTEDLKK